MAKKLLLGPILAPLDKFTPLRPAPHFFSWILHLLDVRHSCKISLYAISRKINQPNLRKWQKKLVLGPVLTRIQAAKLIWLRQSVDTMVSYHHIQYQKKRMTHSWENLVTDGQMGRHMERWTRVIAYNAVGLTTSIQKIKAFV